MANVFWNYNGLRVRSRAWSAVSRLVALVRRGCSPVTLAVAEDIFLRGLTPAEIRAKRDVSLSEVWRGRDLVLGAVDLAGLEWPLPREPELNEASAQRLLPNKMLGRFCPYQWRGGFLLTVEEEAEMKRRTRARVAGVLRQLNFDDLFRLSWPADKRKKLKITKCRERRLEELSPQIDAIKEELVALGFPEKKRLSHTKSRYFESRME